MWKRNPNWIVFVLVGFLLGGMGGCRRVARLDVGKTVDLSDRWNDTDSQQAAKTLIEDVLSRPWIDQFQRGTGRVPRVIVGTVVNKSHDHIPTQTFTKDLERELTNSGRVAFVASAGERGELREERDQQQLHSSEETAKGLRKEVAADYMLIGEINSFEEQAEGKKYKYFHLTLELIDLESNLKVWLGDKKIKKLMTRPPFGL